MARDINGPSRERIADLVAQLAFGRMDDPSIAARLELTASQVRTLREEFDIPPGETRWVSPHHPSRQNTDTTGADE